VCSSDLIQHLENPRIEAEEHYYNPKHTGLLDLGLQPHYLTDEVIRGMLERVYKYRDCISHGRIMRNVRWA